MNENSKEYKQLYKWKGHKHRIECFIHKLNNQTFTTWKELRTIQKLKDKLNKMLISKEEYNKNVNGFRCKKRLCNLPFMEDFFTELPRYNKEVKEKEHKIYKIMKKRTKLPIVIIKKILLYL